MNFIMFLFDKFFLSTFVSSSNLDRMNNPQTLITQTVSLLSFSQIVKVFNRHRNQDDHKFFPLTKVERCFGWEFLSEGNEKES